MNPEIIFDGAFGTYISLKKLQLDFPEMANLTEPDTVLSIHKEYIASGATAIKTNTFAANPIFIADTDVLKSIIKNGVHLANQAVNGTNVKVFADIGPINGIDATEKYKQVAGIFIDCGLEHFLFETLSEVKSLQDIIAYIKNKIPDSVVIASFAVSQDGYTKLGGYYTDLLEEAASYGADYVGLNCVCGPSHMLNLIKGIPAGKNILIAMPNSGYPSSENGRTIYVDNPNYFAEKLFDIYSCGVKAVGGCCGTTPEHIRQFNERMNAMKPLNIGGRGVKGVRTPAVEFDFDREDKIIAVEVNAPVDSDINFTLKAAKMAKECGADFVTVPDSPLGMMRANSLMISSLIQRTVHIKVIPHICCRDKNQIAIKGDLIAANIEGITNILALTGDPVPEADRGNIKNVFGFNSIKLINFIKSLNNTVFNENPYNICAALNINAINFDSELKRAEEKIAKGTVCFFTQPIFSEKNVKNYLKAKAVLDSKILAGILLVAGYKNALFLNNEAHGIEIPEYIIDEFKDKNKEETKEISLNYAKSIMEQLGSDCDGYYFIVQLKRIDILEEIIKYIRKTDV